MGQYQAHVYGFEGLYYKPNGPMYPFVSAPTRKEARKRLRSHLLAGSVTPITIRRLIGLRWKKKQRGGKRRTASQL